MCGIAGFVDFNNKSNEKTIQSMIQPIHHRGPDDTGSYLYNDFKGSIGFGHKRLSIIDISSGGHQPMHYEQYTIVFNGEMYNYKSVRSELEKEGYTFDSASDTAVILRAFHKWGVQAVHKFIGMFSFAILDRKTNQLYIFRDRAGVKPLYYYHQKGHLLFASELKAFYDHPAFVKELDHDALVEYFLYGYILAPHTVFKNTYKLRPGHFLEVNLETQKVREEKYWDIVDHFKKPKLKISETEAIEETEKLLTSAFEYRMVSDVPVGIFLSGGYDSSTVAAILQKGRTEKLKTFTIGFHLDGFNEAVYAKDVANYLGTDHTELYCTEAEAEGIFPELPFYYDEPFADSSAIPTILVSRLARKKVTVALSADGGDELFGGYRKHHSVLRALSRLQRVPSFMRKPIGSVVDLFPPRYIPFLNKTYRFDHFYHSVADLFKGGVYPDQILRLTSHHINRRGIDKLFKNSVKELPTNFTHTRDIEFADPLDPALAVDYKTYMVDDILVKVDRATMSVSLEGREPFLDHRIAEFVSQLPSSLKIRNGEKKYLLKQVTHKYIPKKMMDRPKMGFGIPVEHWFRKDLKDTLLFYLDDEKIRKQGLFDVGYLQQVKKRYFSGINEDFEFIWAMIVFQMWFDRWMK
ncbi:asparagine synthase (glutamine-hydrolyzing) [Fulvivirgaceae bacterium PWU4]|uniref:asparagine synthase (glutamine-hydrolyzing) n=1 Tax=Chryseosolibacter histidini TaxID=2782349 RepID=A0AAP2DTH3_9BACT|nr:asparagine synthase (glutamine-hydrolyzing) [Chryseosolibacter histidini]MBT1700922.1 asparagine synthase (glutamine-hydrolyzing) [Chryseosolibacter histidini]